MRKKQVKKIGSILVSAAIVSSMMFGSVGTVYADTWPYTDDSKIGENQPIMYGERLVDLRNWSPETDPYSDLMRAQVPLQQRIEPYQSTQANPVLGSDAEIMYMAGDYGNSFTQATPYNNQFSENHFGFWQYVDYYAAWHGAAIAGTPLSLWTGYSENEDPTGNGWATQRNFEFGAINMPNPGYTNAAHKNGVLSLGCVYFDPNNRPGQPVTPMFEQDANGNFPLAKKLIEYAKWYGFDGWFFNQEESVPKEQVPLYKAFIKQVREGGLYCQMYDAMDTNGNINGWRSQLDEDIYTFLNDPEVGGVNDSMFISYDWSANRKDGKSKLQVTLDTIAAHSLDPFQTTFFGVESSQGKMSSIGHNSTYNFPVLYKDFAAKELYGSIALFTPDSFVHDDIEGAIKNGKDNNRARDEFQWMVMERERLYFSGPTENPAKAGIIKDAKREDLGLDNIGGWGGVAEFASERSVAGGTNFYSNFNTGHGLEYRIDGKVSSADEFGNMNLQDILPTWQWWIDSNGSKLDVDFDYGPKFTKADKNGVAMAFDYKQIGAYNGGSSLVVNGKLDSVNFLHLFKTDLKVQTGSKASISYNKVSDDTAKMQLGLIFKNERYPVYIDIPGTDLMSNGWNTAELDLAAFADKEIAAIGLNFTGTSTNYQMNIGEIKILDGEDYTPEVPKGFALSKVFETGEIVATWEKADFNNVKQYNLYATYSDGSREFLGGIYGDSYYIKSVDKDLTGIELTAIGPDGSESVPARVDYSFSTKVRGIKVNEQNTASGLLVQSAVAGQVEVSWAAPQIRNYTGFHLELSLNYSDNTSVYTVDVPASARSAKIDVPINEGLEYTLKISTVDGDKKDAPICYTGYLKDTYCKPFGERVTFNGKTAEIYTPDASDWWHIYVTYDGKELNIPVKYPYNNTASPTGVKGVARINVIALPYEGGTLGIQLQDYSGNLSEIVTIPYSK